MTTMLANFMGLGMMELVVLAFLGLLIFGKKLPEVGKSLGKGIVSFKNGLQGMETQIGDAVNAEPTPRKKKKKKKRPVLDSAQAATSPMTDESNAEPMESVTTDRAG